MHDRCSPQIALWRSCNGRPSSRNEELNTGSASLVSLQPFHHLTPRVKVYDGSSTFRKEVRKEWSEHPPRHILPIDPTPIVTTPSAHMNIVSIGSTITSL